MILNSRQPIKSVLLLHSVEEKESHKLWIGLEFLEVEQYKG